MPLYATEADRVTPGAAGFHVHVHERFREHPYGIVLNSLLPTEWTALLSSFQDCLIALPQPDSVSLDAIREIHNYRDRLVLTLSPGLSPDQDRWVETVGIAQEQYHPKLLIIRPGDPANYKGYEQALAWAREIASPIAAEPLDFHTLLLLTAQWLYDWAMDSAADIGYAETRDFGRWGLVRDAYGRPIRSFEQVGSVLRQYATEIRAAQEMLRVASRVCSIAFRWNNASPWCLARVCEMLYIETARPLMISKLSLPRASSEKFLKIMRAARSIGIAPVLCQAYDEPDSTGILASPTRARGAARILRHFMDGGNGRKLE